MKTNMKKIISKLLVVCLLVSLLPAFALLEAKAVSDNPYGPTEDTKPEVTVDVPATEAKTDETGIAKAEITEEKMETAVTDAILAAASAVEDVVPVVTIPVTTSADATGLEVKLPTDSLQKLVNEVKDAAVAIASEKASVKIDNKALTSLVNQAGGGSISFEVAPVTADKIPEAQKAALDSFQSKVESQPGGVKVQTQTYDLSMMSNDRPIHNFGTGTLDVELAYTVPTGSKAEDVRAYYLNDRGLIERFAVKVSNGKVSFKTGHLSTYVISDKALTAETVFTDVPADEWYPHYVNWAADNGITVGNGDGTFTPTSDCTRAQFVTFLYRAAGAKPVTGVANPFTDVSASDVGEEFYNAILWAYSNGITVGTNEDNTTFEPDAPVLRGQAVTFMSRYAAMERIAGATGDNPFTDVANEDEVAYYYDAIRWAAANGISVGNSDGGSTFGPLDNCERAEMVTFLYRLFMLAE